MQASRIFPLGALLFRGVDLFTVAWITNLLMPTSTLTRLFTAAMIVMFAAGCNTQSSDSAPQTDAISAGDDHVLKLPTGTLRLPKSDWKAITNEYEWAENFEQTQKAPRHEFPRVVTVFKLPMTDDRRVGVRISPNEYVELFFAHPGMLTMLVRVDKKQYWLSSRETFKAQSIHGVGITTDYHTLHDEEFKWALQEFQAELDTTRYLLQSRF